MDTSRANAGEYGQKIRGTRISQMDRADIVDFWTGMTVVPKRKIQNYVALQSDRSEEDLRDCILSFQKTKMAAMRPKSAPLTRPPSSLSSAGRGDNHPPYSTFKGTNEMLPATPRKAATPSQASTQRSVTPRPNSQVPQPPPSQKIKQFPFCSVEGKAMITEQPPAHQPPAAMPTTSGPVKAFPLTPIKNIARRPAIADPRQKPSTPRIYGSGGNVVSHETGGAATPRRPAAARIARPTAPEWLRAARVSIRDPTTGKEQVVRPTLADNERKVRTATPRGVYRAATPRTEVRPATPRKECDATAPPIDERTTTPRQKYYENPLLVEDHLTTQREGGRPATAWPDPRLASPQMVSRASTPCKVNHLATQRKKDRSATPRMEDCTATVRIEDRPGTTPMMDRPDTQQTDSNATAARQKHLLGAPEVEHTPATSREAELAEDDDGEKLLRYEVRQPERRKIPGYLDLEDGQERQLNITGIGGLPKSCMDRDFEKEIDKRSMYFTSHCVDIPSSVKPKFGDHNFAFEKVWRTDCLDDLTAWKTTASPHELRQMANHCRSLYHWNHRGKDKTTYADEYVQYPIDRTPMMNTGDQMRSSIPFGSVYCKIHAKGPIQILAPEILQDTTKPLRLCTYNTNNQKNESSEVKRCLNMKAPVSSWRSEYRSIYQ
eukprot:GEMP01015682.1.p1 GENE.GEMP01015682.1~~GEMP01015682.1.p1  ORF type:complete len:671 (+),score=141.50 GEMP01015682.1:26-2014(+)